MHTPTDTSSDQAPRWMVAGVLLAITATVAITALRVARAWPRDAHLGYAEGTWIALAIDAAHGVFYRPLEGALGYGGTRYFPLFFTVHGALIRIGLPPIAAGYGLAAISVVLLLLGVVGLVRAVGGSALLAAMGAGLALGSQPVQMALLSIRGDGLAAACTLLGLACCVDRRRLRYAPLLFSLAFAAKPTSLYGPAAACLSLVGTGRGPEGLRLAIRTAIGLVVVLVAVLIASEGRMWSIFAASASGGSSVTSLLSAPISFSRMLRRVPESTFFIQLAAAAIIAQLGRTLRLERASFLVCFAATLAIYGSPATVENHLIDLAVLGVITIVCVAARNPQRLRAVLALALVGSTASAATALWRFKTEDAIDMRSSRLAVNTAIGDVRSPVLVEQPMLAATANLQTYVLDPHILNVRAAAEPAIAAPMISALHERRFGALVFEQAAPEQAMADILSGDTLRRFQTALHESYQLDRVVEGRAIYRSRPQ